MLYLNFIMLILFNLNETKNKLYKKIAEKVSKLLNESFQNTKLTIAFKLPLELAKQFPFKDSIRDIKTQSFVVYKIKCLD
jgi:hypothetical protein